MKQETRDKILTAFLTVIKIYGAWIAARATYQVSRDVQLVIAIEGVMLGMWFVGIFGGNGGKALAVKPFAFGVAWILYIGQLVIGWEAAPDVTSILARVGTAGLLLVDSWAYVVALRSWATRKQTVKQETHTEWKTAVRVFVSNTAYGLAVVAVWPIVFCVQIVRVIADYVLDVFYALRLRVEPDTRTNEQTDRRTITQHLVVDHSHKQTISSLPSYTQTDKQTGIQNLIANQTDKLANKQNTQPRVSARYTQTDNDRWVWVCVCGASSLNQTRGQTDYATHAGAQKGFAGHSQTHTFEAGVSVAAQVESIETIDNTEGPQ